MKITQKLADLSESQGESALSGELLAAELVLAVLDVCSRDWLCVPPLVLVWSVASRQHICFYHHYLGDV